MASEDMLSSKINASRKKNKCVADATQQESKPEVTPLSNYFIQLVEDY